jgi:hypothetical protein
MRGRQIRWQEEQSPSVLRTYASTLNIPVPTTKGNIKSQYDRISCQLRGPSMGNTIQKNTFAYAYVGYMFNQGAFPCSRLVDTVVSLKRRYYLWL